MDENQRLKPGQVRDAIIDYLKTRRGGDAHVTEIIAGVEKQLGVVSHSSVRSYLRLNTPDVFERTATGRYRLRQ